MQAIVNAVLAVQAYVTANATRLDEVEINPLICTPTRAVAADALIRIRRRNVTDSPIKTDAAVPCLR